MFMVVDEAVPGKLADEAQAIFTEAEERSGAIMPSVLVYSDCSHAMSPRNFAGIIVGKPAKLHLCDDLAEQPLTRIRGILWHEAGHLLDWMAGRRWRRYKDNSGLDSEQRTDHAVEVFCGERIYYDEDMVQRVGRKQRGWISPRPEGLR